MILLAAFAFVLGCSGGDQQAEVNKIVDQANKKLDDAKDLFSKTEERNTALFNTKIQTVPQLHAYKEKMSGEAKSIVADYEKAADMLKDVSKQYDDISRMNVNDKYKEYAKLKSDAFAKRAEAIGVRKGNAQAFMEIADPKTMVSKFNENNTKAEKLFKDAADIAAKAQKIEDDNKEIFKN
jgi:predicted phage tail protein